MSTIKIHPLAISTEILYTKTTNYIHQDNYTDKDQNLIPDGTKNILPV